MGGIHTFACIGAIFGTIIGGVLGIILFNTADQLAPAPQVAHPDPGGCPPAAQSCVNEERVATFPTDVKEPSRNGRVLLHLPCR